MFKVASKSRERESVFFLFITLILRFYFYTCSLHLGAKQPPDILTEKRYTCMCCSPTANLTELNMASSEYKKHSDVDDERHPEIAIPKVLSPKVQLTDGLSSKTRNSVGKPGFSTI